MGRAGSGGHSGGHSSGGHSSSRTSGGHSFGGGSSHRAGSGSSHSGPSFGGGYGGGYHSSPFGNYNYYGPTYVGRRFYGSGGFSGITGIIILIIVLVAMFGGLSTKGSIPASTQNREKVQTGVAFNNNCIVDEIGWIDNLSKTEKRLQNFYNKTGIQPYVVFHKYDESLKTESDKEVYANKYYEENIDNEGTFLFMYFAEQATDDDVGYMCYVNGKQVTSVMDSEAVDIFWAYIDEYWATDMSTDDVIVKTFDSTAKRIMDKSTTGADVAKYAVVLVIICVGGFVVIRMLRMKFKRDKEKAEETERILKTPLDKSEDDLLNKYK